MTQVVHIDGDILVYAAGFAAERGEYRLSYADDVVEYFPLKKEMVARLSELGNPPHVVEFERHPEPVEYALHNVKMLVGSIMEACGGGSEYFVYLSGPTNFRDSVATIRPYKGNRDKTHKPVHGPAIREFLRNYHPCVVSDGEEADDVIGYTHYARYLTDEQSSIIATQDKDLNMIPGAHYNFLKKEQYWIIPEAADYFFYKQLLTGDTTDNIVGVPGIGPKRAEKLLEKHLGDKLSMYQVCKETYNNDAALLENARLLWIRRYPNEQWEPPSAVC